MKWDHIKIKYYIFYILPIIIWISGVFFLSNQSFHQQDIRPLLSHYLDPDLLKKILPEIKFTFGSSRVSTEDPIRFLHFVFRKGAHIFFYGILGVLLFRAIYKKWRSLIGATIFSLSLVLNTAVLDEWNQSLNPNRTGSACDVLLDFMGAILFIGFYLIMVSLYEKKKTINKKAPSN